jgi:hypothetical protein
MRSTLQRDEVIVFKPTVLFQHRLSLIMATVGGLSFDALLNSLTSLDTKRGWQALNKRLRRSRWMNTWDIMDESRLGGLHEFVQLIGDAASDIGRVLSPLNGITLKPTRQVQVILSGVDADRQRDHFDSNMTYFSWLCNTHGTYKFDYWRGSHDTLCAIEAVMATMTEKGNPYGEQIPHQFIEHATPLTTRELGEMEIVVFGHQVLHRCTENDTGRLHAQVFGSLQGAIGRKKMSTSRIGETLESTSNTFFLQEHLWPLFTL